MPEEKKNIVFCMEVLSDILHVIAKHITEYFIESTDEKRIG